ncbi:hypothetical protein DNHGIG_18640 [Collibacillus ludicampi]|uniref:Uncharacterized protein n=1 Tax=Collibacillus ludicampi TaxID=2771369 RepID=A0AAV4LEQ4_9BACL|nr:hypothetical protein [Collibacillus ludicampi]GIM46315.1 hypothetical protein DNHGIG_18640 [Collibacillus ludicampi]
MAIGYENERFMRLLPGRVRIQIYGLKKNLLMKRQILHQFSQLEGVLQIAPSVDSGRCLFIFDPKKTSFDRIYKQIVLLEEQTFHIERSVRTAVKEVAATSAAVAQNVSAVPPMTGRIPGKRVPLESALSLGGLGVLSVKQIMTGGPSVLSRHPTAFYLSGFVSILTGYPFFTRYTYSKKRKKMFDWVFACTFILALIRENLVVLAGLSILQYLIWKRGQAIGQEKRQSSVSLHSPVIRQYSERAEKWGFFLALASWAYVRDPLTALAVLLAANPRPATLPAEYAWSHAEVISQERKYRIPGNGSLQQLAQTKTVLFEDTSQIFLREETAGIQCISNMNDCEKIWCTLASIMKNTNHTWKEEVVKRAEQTGRTLRTSFQVHEEERGVKGMISGMGFFLGDKNFMLKHEVDCSEYEWIAHKMEKTGYVVQFVGKEEYDKRICIGVLTKPPRGVTPEFVSIVGHLVQNQWKIAVLHDSLQLDRELYRRLGIDPSWLSFHDEQVYQRICTLRKQGEDVLFIPENEKESRIEYVASGVPSVCMSQLKEIQVSAAYARRIQQMINQHVAVTKIWNIIGTLLIPFGFTAMVINSIADALLLVFLARAKRISESPLSLERKGKELNIVFQERRSCSKLRIPMCKTSFGHT